MNNASRNQACQVAVAAYRRRGRAREFLLCHLLFFLVSVTNAASAEKALTHELSRMSLEELMSIKVNVVSNTLKSIREQPGTVTLITEEQIANSGARYLMDILKQVPGFWVGTDTIGTFSVSFRGVWGMEAKILLIIDGIEQNELAFGSLVLGNRFPASTIKQVEIIRGPGSVKYGGQAALAVIKVTSKGADLGGTQIAVATDFNSDGLNNSTYAFVSGGKLSEASDLNYVALASFGRGDYSDKEWIGLDGYRYDLEGKANSEPVNLNLAIMHSDFEWRFIYDRFRQEDRLLFGDSGLFVSPFLRYTETNTLSFESFNISANYRWQLNEQLSLDSKLVYVQQKPWNSDSQYDQRLRRTAERWRVDLATNYSISDYRNLTVGAQYYTENERVNESHLFNPDTRFEGANSTSQDDYALYVQYEGETDWANFTLGGRYEHHDYAGSQFVPRLAITKVLDKIHTKFVFNQAFKIPQFDTIASAANAGTPIDETETTTTLEWELGYRYTPEIFATSNVYWLEVNDYIAFNPITISNTTLGDFSAYGLELEMNWIGESASLSGSYSLFLIDQTNISALTVAADDEAILGIPNHMLKVNANFGLTEHVSLHAVGTFISARYACVDDPSFICGEPKKMPSEADVNAFVRYRDQNIMYSAGIANIFDTSVQMIQPYRGGQSPIPWVGRRITVEFSYQF